MIDCRGGYRFVVGRVLFKNHSIFFWGGGGCLINPIYVRKIFF